MPKLALGRDAVLLRRELPKPARETTSRNIPPEPDDLWDAIAVQARITALNKRMQGPIEQSLAVGLLREQRKDSEILARLLERLEIDELAFEDRLNSTPAAVYAIKLAALGEDEPVNARSASFGDDFVASIYGRGFQFMESIVLSGEFTNQDGQPRSFPMSRAGELQDVTGIQFTSGLRPSDLGFTAGGVVTLVATLTLRDQTVVRRAVERFVVA